MYCRNCGSELTENARFCKKCGTAVSSGQQEETAKPVPESKPVPKSKPVLSARPVSTGRDDKIDGKLIVAVAVFLVLQLAVVTKIVSGVNKVPEGLAVSASANEAEAGFHFDKEIRVGGTVEFGKYEQDGDTGNGLEPIVWDVVGSYEDGYLLVSRYILDGMPWDDGSGSGSTLDLKTEITYEQCSMRRWIRDNFAAGAFTDEERSIIIPVSVKGDDILAEKNNRYATDYAFILREDEVIDYWGYAAPDVANAAIACAPTEYATWSGLVADKAGNARHPYGSTSAAAQWALRRRYTDASAKEAKIVTVDIKGRFSNAFVSEILGFRPAIYIEY